MVLLNELVKGALYAYSGTGFISYYEYRSISLDDIYVRSMSDDSLITISKVRFELMISKGIIKEVKSAGQL